MIKEIKETQDTYHGSTLSNFSLFTFTLQIILIIKMSYLLEAMVSSFQRKQSGLGFDPRVSPSKPTQGLQNNPRLIGF